MPRFLLLLALLPCLVSCQNDQDELFTQALISFAAKGERVEQLQGTLTLTNVNTRERVTTAAFTAHQSQLAVLRGAYEATFVGTVRSVDAEGQAHTRAATAHADLLNLVATPQAAATLQILFR